MILLAVPNVQKLHQKIFAHNLLTCNRQTKILGTYLGTFVHTIRLTWNCIQYSSIELHSANNFLPTIRVIRDIFRVNNATVVFKHLDLNILYNSLPMIGSGPRISNAVSDCSINWATTTARLPFFGHLSMNAVSLRWLCSSLETLLFRGKQSNYFVKRKEIITQLNWPNVKTLKILKQRTLTVEGSITVHTSVNIFWFGQIQSS